MAEHGFTLLATPIGVCAIVFGEQALLGVLLPEADEAALRARVRDGFPDACERDPPAFVRDAGAGIVGLLRGELVDLGAIALDMHRVPPFHRRVYELARTIAPGATCSYGELATQLGSPGASRAVGQALGRNPFAIVVPCHRVLAAGGKTGGFTANGGVDTKLRMLSLEAAPKERGAAPVREPPEPRPSTLFAGAGTFAFDTEHAIDVLRASDAKLATLIDRVGPCTMRLEKTESVFGALAQAIVYQQLTGKAAATIFARVQAVAGEPGASVEPARLLAASDEALRGAGLSGNKTRALRDLAQRTVDGELPTLAELHELDDARAIERLVCVRGVGRWTVEMVLMFRLGRPDVFPFDDFGIRKGFALAFGTRELPSRTVMARRSAKWKPYRSVASWYLWRAVDLALARTQASSSTLRG